MIVDYAKIHVKAGSGGKGANTKLMLSVRRVIGGGGDGGNGGDVILEVSPHLYDLNKFKEKKKFIAQDGFPGKDNNRRGKNGEDTVIGFPIGTVVWDENEAMLVELKEPGQRFVVCRGGKGGEGNYKKFYTLPPHPGEGRDIILDYRVLADIAVIGFANSGKTTLVNALTGRNFKVADYPFTTTSCYWAPAVIGDKKITVIDMPPIKKNSFARGYDTSLLRQLTRPRIFLLLSEDPVNCLAEYKEFIEEIKHVDTSLLEGKKVFYLLTKTDKIDKDNPHKTTDYLYKQTRQGRACGKTKLQVGEQPADDSKIKISKIKGIIPISVHSGMGVEKLKKKIAACL
jgi:GTP-binding protein